jgi:microcystin-dependent protein
VEVGAVRVKYKVANASVLAQLMALNRAGNAETAWGPEFLITPEDGGYSGVQGIRFRDAVAGTHAEIVASSFSEDDPRSEGAVPFLSEIGSGGQIIDQGSGVTGDVVFSAAATRADSLPCDGGTYNSLTDTTLANLFAAIGTTYGGTGPGDFKTPDVQGRVIVAKGTHADVNALGDSDAIALASRRPFHTHPIAQTANFAGGAGTADTGANTGTNGPAYITLNAFILK